MPTVRHARPALDETEDPQVRKLATSHHARAEWIGHAKLLVHSWTGDRGAHQHECSGTGGSRADGP